MQAETSLLPEFRGKFPLKYTDRSLINRHWKKVIKFLTTGPMQQLNLYFIILLQQTRFFVEKQLVKYRYFNSTHFFQKDYSVQRSFQTRSLHTCPSGK